MGFAVRNVLFGEFAMSTGWKYLAGSLVLSVERDESLYKENEHDARVIVMCLNRIASCDDCPAGFSDLADDTVLSPDGMWGDPEEDAWNEMKRLLGAEHEAIKERWRELARNLLAVIEQLQPNAESGSRIINGVVGMLMNLGGAPGAPAGFVECYASLCFDEESGAMQWQGGQAAQIAWEWLQDEFAEEEDGD